MAQIWIDTTTAMNNVTVDNANEVLRFKWDFVTFSGESQDKAQIRWRKMGTTPQTSPSVTIRQMMSYSDDVYTGYATVDRHSFSYGYNITTLDFPIGTFAPGVYAFQVNFFATGASDWSGWSAVHRIEITPFEEHQTFSGAANGASTAVVKGPHAQTEGPHNARVEVVSSAGISAVSNEQSFRFWETNKYQKQADGTLKPQPELWHNGTIIGRVKRTA